MISFENIDEQFAARLAELRVKKGVSAREMSLSIGQSENLINTYENKKSFPSMSVFFYICEYLDISPQEFFDFDSKNPQELRDLIDDLKKLDIVQLECVRTIVAAFIKANEK